MRRCLLFILVFLIFPALCLASRGISLNIKTSDGGTQSVPLYKESHALLVGVSDYTNGWPDLTSIPGEMKKLEQALKGQGFNVVKVINPDSKKLSAAFEDFINEYGFDPENRLLFFFSGHGYSRTEVEKGYIVPADAPSPLDDKRGFARKAIEMDRIVTWARRIESKHALFLFDSCFSGTVFQSRALPKEPPHISAMVARPIRQFISAGSAGEEVPAKSYFVPSFIRAIEGEGDLDQDGYITGTELGMYLNRKVSGYQVGQTPQYGKIRDPRLDQGDFVMVAGLNQVTDVRTPQPEKKSVGTLDIAVQPSGASVYLNGKYQGAGPLTLTGLAAGRFPVKLEKSGYLPYEAVVLIRAGRTVALDVSLDKIVTTGSLKVGSTPSGASWYLDGAYVGKTPDTMADLAPGNYKIKMNMAGYADFSETVRVSKGRRSQLLAAMKKTQTVASVQTTSGAFIEMMPKIELVSVPGGCYQMGDQFGDGESNEKPVHNVCVDSFSMGKYEVTQGQWRKVMGNNPSRFKDGDNYPVEKVSWNDVQEFIKKLNRQTGKTFRLPTEAEWEYAARSGGKLGKYAGGNNVDSIAWYDKNSGRKTHPVGRKQPNGLGLYDMTGNVWEWCQDWYGEKYYGKGPRQNPQGPSGGSYRVFRGGSWLDGVWGLRSSVRYGRAPGLRITFLGFRLLIQS